MTASSAVGGGSTCLTATRRPAGSGGAREGGPVPPPPMRSTRRYRSATRWPGPLTVCPPRPPPAPEPRSDAARDAVPAGVLLLGARGQDVVELAELLDHVGGQVVEQALPGRGLVVAAGQQQLPGARLPVALAALGDELREVPVLGGVLLLLGRRGRQLRGVGSLEDRDDRLHDVGPEPVGLVHGGCSPVIAHRWFRRPVQRAPPGGGVTTPVLLRWCATPGAAGDRPCGDRYPGRRSWRIRLVAYGARLESGLGATPREFESPILRRCGLPAGSRRRPR